MKYLVVTLLSALLFGFYTGSAQEEKDVFEFVESQPLFPGGDEAMMRFILDNIVYPEMARETGTQGTVYIKFIIETDGSLTDFKVLRGVSKELDDEALRVLKMMPNWTPGKQRGKAVRCYYTIPIKFVLAGGSSTTSDKEAKTKKWWQFWKKKS